MKLLLYLVALGSVAASAAVSAIAGEPQLQLGQALLPPGSGELGPAAGGAGVTLRLQAQFDCGVPEAEPSLFVSVADTAVAAQATESPQIVTLEVPESQLRGVRESLSCPGLGPHLLRSQLTAYATLICRTADGKQSSATVRRGLDLWVECEQVSTEETGVLSEEELEDS